MLYGSAVELVSYKKQHEERNNKALNIYYESKEDISFLAAYCFPLVFCPCMTI